MGTKLLLIGFFLMLLATEISSQRETNPKLVSTFPTRQGSILIVDTWKEIHSSGINSNDLLKMNETVLLLERRTKEQDETIKKQQSDIVKLQRANKEMEAKIQSLQRTVAQMQKSIDAIEKKLPK